MPPPALVNLESTLGCNLECVMCGSYLSGVTKQRQVMSAELLEKVEREVLPGALDISLTVAGEPWITPKLSHFVALAERAGVQLQMNSNATLIRDGELLRRILRQSSAMKFSVDGATAETYHSIRGLSDFTTVLSNIRAVVRARAELPADEQPRLALCMVLMRRNVHELVQMVDLARELGVDRLEVAHLTVLVPEMDGESLRHSPELADTALRAARVRADALGFRAHLPPLMSGQPLPQSGLARLRLFRREAPSIGRRRVGRLLHQARHQAKLGRWSLSAGGRVPCPFLQGAVFVTIGGDVAPCPMPGRPIVGNLLQQSFTEIWNGPVLSAMRQGFIRGEPFACCAHCSQNPNGYKPADEATARPRAYELFRERWSRG